MSEELESTDRPARFVAKNCPSCLRANTEAHAQCEHCGASLQWDSHGAFRDFLVAGRQRAVRTMQWASVEFFFGLISLILLAIMLPRALQRGMFLAIVPWALFSFALIIDGGRRAYRASRVMLLD